MASPTVSSDINPPDPSWQVRQELPIMIRRCGAWAVEVSLIVASALVPWSLGALTNKGPQTVPLNPAVTVTSEAIAKTLALPLRDRSPRVAPITNLLWSAALLAPIALTGWQLYLLVKTGQTTPKRWLKIKVTTASGGPLTWQRVLLREGLGRWGLPLGVAYTLWKVSGAFPDLIILGGLGAIALVGDGMIARWDRQRRTGHDRLANTLAIDARTSPQTDPNPFNGQDWTEEDAAIAAIVLTPESTTDGSQGLWKWMRQHPGLTLLIVTTASMTAILGTFIGTQVYIQSQTNFRDSKHRDNELFLTLLNKLSQTSPNSLAGRREAILALGVTQDARAIPLLANLLKQEENRALLDVIQQALVTRGSQALPYLQQLSQALSNDLDSMRYGGNAKERELVAIQQQATQRAIGKILTVYSGKLNGVDLSRTDLSQTPSGPAQFTLVLDKVDLAGIRLRGANLSKASLQGARFYAGGEDRRFGTFDDWIADLSGTNFEGANLTGASLGSSVMNRTNFLKATLNKANLSNGILNGANLSSALLIGADLRQASLKDASLTGADLGGANLSNANLEGTRSNQVKGQGVQLQAANLARSDWQGADLSGANLRDSNLQNVNFTSVRLANANLNNAQLQNTNLRNADLSLVDLRGANVAGANFQGATFVAKQMRSDQFIQSPPVSSKSGRLQGVDFSETKNLDSTQIAYICLQGGLHPKCPQKK